MYEIKKYEKNVDFSIIQLNEKVLGGNDALNFTSALQELNYENCKYLIVNLDNVKVMNSSGLGMLVGGLRQLEKKNITLILVSVPDTVKELLEMTHLIKVFKKFADIEEAVENLS